MSDVPPKKPTKPNPNNRVQVAIRLTPTGLAEVDDLAERDQRTRSDMVRILLAEAIAERRRKERLGR